MENVSTRTWAVIGFMGLLVFFSYWMRLSIKHPEWNPLTMGFTYEMPRPQNFDLGFDLSDREIESRYKTTKVDAQTEKKADAKPLDPKAAIEAEAKKAAAAKAEAAKRAAAARAARMSVATVDTSRNPQMSAMEGDMAPSGEAPAWYGAQGAAAQAGAKAATDPKAKKDKDEEDATLTPAQWRALLQNAPTGENVAKFVRAKQSGKLDATAFYEITHELLSDSAADRRKAGYQVLDSDPSAGTYVFIVTELTNSQTQADEQTQLKRYLDAYSTPARLAILAEVMRSDKTAAVLQSAAENLATALSAYKKALEEHPDAGPRNAGGFTAQQFTAFLSVLQTLAADGTSPIANQASQLATEIQSLTQTNS